MSYNWSSTPIDRMWWKKENDSQRSHAFVNEARRISYETSERQTLIMRGGALYGDTGGLRGTVGLSGPTGLMAHNVLATATDALVAEVTQSPPRPVAVTVGGTFAERKRALKLTHYWEAKFDECDVHPKGRQCVRDSILSGLGILRPYRVCPEDLENDKVAVERIYPGNFLMDDLGSVDSFPRNAYIRRFVDREWLAAQYPEHAEEIRNTSLDMGQTAFTRNSTSDIVEVYEGWRLATVEGAEDGLYCMAVENVVLLEAVYTRTKFPLAFVRPVPPMFGYWPSPLILRGAPAQKELNKLIRRIQESMHLHAVPRTFLQKQAGGMTTARMTNHLGVVAYYEGNPPVFMTPQSMNNDVFSYVGQLEQWIYRELGVSELSANSTKPAGLDSGTALRTYNDVQSRRWINLQRSYEDMHVELAYESAHLEQDISDDKASVGMKHHVGYNSRKYVKETEWKDIYLDPERYRTRVYSASALPNTPAGKLQALEEMVKLQVIDPEQFIQLADMPDFESVRNLKVAPKELLEDTFDTMLEEDKFIEPEIGMDFELGRVLCVLSIQRAKLEGAGDELLDHLRNWVIESYALEDRVARMNQPEEPPPMMGPGAPGETMPAGTGMEAIPGAGMNPATGPAMQDGTTLVGAMSQPTMADVPAPYGAHPELEG